MAQFPCPYVSPNGDRCPGHIVKVKAFNADLRWTFDESGNWTIKHSQPRSQYHLFCSEKGNHADDSGAEQMQCYTGSLPDELLVVISTTAEQFEMGPNDVPEPDPTSPGPVAPLDTERMDFAQDAYEVPASCGPDGRRSKP